MRSWERFWEVLGPLGEALGVPGAIEIGELDVFKTGWIKSKKIISNRSKIISNRSNIKPQGGLRESVWSSFWRGLERGWIGFLVVFT